MDFAYAQKELDQIKDTKQETTKEHLKRAVIFTSRALLITKGFEPKDDLEAVKLFKEYFIGIHLDSEWDKLINYFLSDQELEYQLVYDFHNTVKSIYSSMDNSLRFPKIIISDNKENNLKMKNDICVHDFRGIPCPLNFVKIKLILETIASGNIIEVWLDSGDPIDRVPDSLKDEGHYILEQKKKQDFWLLKVQKN